MWKRRQGSLVGPRAAAGRSGWMPPAGLPRSMHTPATHTHHARPPGPLLRPGPRSAAGQQPAPQPPPAPYTQPQPTLQVLHPSPQLHGQLSQVLVVGLHTGWKGGKERLSQRGAAPAGPLQAGRLPSTAGRHAPTRYRSNERRMGGTRTQQLEAAQHRTRHTRNKQSSRSSITTAPHTHASNTTKTCLQVLRRALVDGACKVSLPGGRLPPQLVLERGAVQGEGAQGVHGRDERNLLWGRGRAGAGWGRRAVRRVGVRELFASCVCNVRACKRDVRRGAEGQRRALPPLHYHRQHRQPLHCHPKHPASPPAPPPRCAAAGPRTPPGRGRCA